MHFIMSQKETNKGLSVRWWAPCWNSATNQRVHTWKVEKRHFTGDVSTTIAQHENLAAKGIFGARVPLPFFFSFRSIKNDPRDFLTDQ